MSPMETDLDSLATSEQVLDLVRSIILKLKDFPRPVKPDETTKSLAKIPNWTVDPCLLDCVAMAITTFHLCEAINEGHKFGRKEIRLLHATMASVELVKSHVNKALSQLLPLSQKHGVCDEKYVRHFSKSVGEIQKKIEACKKDYHPIIELLQLPSMNSTIHYLTQMASSDDDKVYSTDLLTEYEKLKQYADEAGRHDAQMRLEGQGDYASPAKSTRSRPLTPMSERVLKNAMVASVMQSPRPKPKPKTPKTTLAERQGWVSRTQRMWRDPNWNAGSKTQLSSDEEEEEEPDESMVEESPSRKDIRNAEWPLCCDTASALDATPPPEDDGEPSSSRSRFHAQFLPNDRHTGASSSSTKFDYAEVYDSYHDHPSDAVLGVPGVVVQRQPSHKRQHRSPSRTTRVPLPLPPPPGCSPPVPVRNDAARQAARANSSPISSSSPRKKASSINSPSKYANMDAQAIRDQYY